MAAGLGKTRDKVILTHKAIEALKPAADAYRVPDLRCPGLAIRVATSGLKTWDFVARVRGTSTIKRKALGAFPAVSLDAARVRATAIGRAAQSGRDLVEEEREARAEAAARMTIRELIDEYVKRGCAKLRTRHEIKLRLNRALVDHMDRPAETIRRREIRVLLDAVSDAGTTREAEQRRVTLSGMFRWAVAQDIVPDNPVRGLKAYSVGELRDRVLSADELRAFWNFLSVSGMADYYVDALRLQLCFGSRIGEAAGITVEELDTEKWTWTLPGARSKNGKPRVTPVIGLAREIIEERLRRTRKGPLFTNEQAKTLASNDVGSQIVTRREHFPIAHFTSHDLRRTVATQMIDLGISYDTVASVLGHEPGSKTTRTLIRHYVRSDLLPQKKRALEAWDARLRDIIEGKMAPSNVVQMAEMMRAAI